MFTELPVLPRIIFLYSFDICLNKITSEQKLCYIMGDFNLDLTNYSTHQPTEDFVNISYAYGLCPLIDQPTRISSHSSTLIDNIFTNNSTNISASGIIYADISDHLPLFQITPNCFQDHYPKPNTYIARDICSDTLSAFKADIECTDWSKVYDCIEAETAYNTFLDQFTALYNHHFPLVTKVVRKGEKNQSWMTQGILKSCKFKYRLYKRFLRNPTVANEQRYKRFRNRLTQVIREAKREHYASRFANAKNDTKSTWREINNILGKNKKDDLPDNFRHADQSISNPSDIAENFNSYFSSIGSTLASSIPSIDHAHFIDFLQDRNKSSLFLSPTVPSEISQVVDELKNASCGFDGIHSSVIKSCIPFISHPLAYIFNLSILTGSVPSNLKIAKVTPIFKNGDRHSFSNYRPISVLPCFSKILEKLIYKRLSNFLSKYHILYDQQFGFRNNYSTDLALIHLIDHLSSSLSDKLHSVGVFLDLSKAFDTIDHSILLSKLEYYGVRGIALQWFTDYLSNRKQYTTVQNCDSSRLTINYGVPQGSILGPLLFILYINDLHYCSSLLSFILFADDTTIFFSHRNFASLINILNLELVKVSFWFQVNKLSLNSSKSKYMIFSRSPNSTHTEPVKINNTVISKVNSAKFLGIMIDDQLSWSPHITSVSNVISRNTGVISKLHSFLPSTTLFSLYNTLILPYLNYCNVVWARTSTSKLQSLIKVQKRAIRICTRSQPRDHTAPLFAKLRTLTLVDINKLQMGIIMYKFTNNLLPSTFSSYFTSVRNIHQYHTRSHNNLYVPFTRTSFSMNTLRFCGPRLWNGLDPQIKSQSSVGRFKSQYKTYLLTQYLT